MKCIKKHAERRQIRGPYISNAFDVLLTISGKASAMAGVLINVVEKPGDGFLVIVVFLAFHDNLEKGELEG